MKKMTKTTGICGLVIATFILVGGPSVLAQDYWVNSGTGDWNEPTNWQSGEVPSEERAYIDNGGTAEVGPDAPPDLQGFTVDGDGSTLNIAHTDGNGWLTANNTANADVGASSGTSTVNHSDGHVIINSLYVGWNGGNGVYNLSGNGTIRINRQFGDDTSLKIGESSGDARFTLKDQSGIHPAQGIDINGGTFAVHGGSHVGVQDTSPSGIVSDNDWDQAAGTLEGRVDADGGLTTIAVNGAALFDSGTELDLGFLDETSPTYGTWTLMETQENDIIDGGLSLSSSTDTDVWSFEVDNSGTNGQLNVTAVPEPSSLVLLGIAGLLMMKRRRV